MKDRIILLIKAKNLTAAQFADEIGVQRSSISHIISGRNNASLDFIQKILIRYPDVNMEWIMLGKGPIFKGVEIASNDSIDKALQEETSTVSGSVDLFSMLIPDNDQEFRSQNGPSTNVDDNPEEGKNKKGPGQNQEQNSFQDIKGKELEDKSHWHENISDGSRHNNTTTKTTVKIVEFYSDNTFREYYPE